MVRIFILNVYIDRVALCVCVFPYLLFGQGSPTLTLVEGRVVQRKLGFGQWVEVWNIQ